MTTTIERLDYSKPPPGYEIYSDWFNDGDSPDAAGVGGALPTEYWQQWQWLFVDSDDDCGDWFAEEDGGAAAAIASAWAHYKAANDPPGLEVFAHPSGGAVFGYERDGYPEQSPGGWSTQAEARAAAWAWHDRRLALATGWARAYESDGDARLLAAVQYTGSDDAMEFDNWWPRCLTWTDEQVAEVERWLADSTAEMPEVLRG